MKHWGPVITFTGIVVLSNSSMGLDFEHTARGVLRRPAPAVCAPAVCAPTVPAAPAVPAPAPTAAEACVSCNQGIGVTKGVDVSVPQTSLNQQVYKVDCVRMDYVDQKYTDFEPRQYSRTENYNVKVNVPYVATGSYLAQGNKTSVREYQYNVCVPVYDRCGCVKWRTETRTGQRTVNEPYTYEQAYQYQANRVEDRVASRDVNYTRMEPVERVRQIPTVVPDARYVQKTTHTATYTVTTTYQNEIPKAEGEALYRQQSTVAAPRPAATP